MEKRIEGVLVLRSAHYLESRRGASEGFLWNMCKEAKLSSLIANDAARRGFAPLCWLVKLCTCTMTANGCE